jgi:hypothetical protein
MIDMIDMIDKTNKKQKQIYKTNKTKEITKKKNILKEVNHINGKINHNRYLVHIDNQIFLNQIYNLYLLYGLFFVIQNRLIFILFLYVYLLFYIKDIYINYYLQYLLYILNI